MKPDKLADLLKMERPITFAPDDRGLIPQIGAGQALAMADAILRMLPVGTDVTGVAEPAPGRLLLIAAPGWTALLEAVEEGNTATVTIRLSAWESEVQPVATMRYAYLKEGAVMREAALSGIPLLKGESLKMRPAAAMAFWQAMVMSWRAAK